MKYLSIFTLLVLGISAERFSYEGYKVYQVTPMTDIQGDVLKSFRESGKFDFWSDAKFLGMPVSIMVKPEFQKRFVQVLNMNKIEYSVLIENAEAAFETERVAQSKAKKVEKGRISFDQYHQYDAIQAYLENLALQYPDKVVVDSFGTSYEGRSLSYIRVGNNPENPTIVMDAGIHAREWIAPAVALYIIQQLVENPEYESLSQTANWVIVPVLNPDGYEFTHTSYRMWRKTRSRGPRCYGVDANRNFGYMWGGLGTSDDECSDIYRGPEAFSESETASFRDLVKSLDNIVLYIALHSYGSWVLYPWGYDYVLTDNTDELNYLGEKIANAIAEVDGERYTVGNAAYLLYPAAGASDDWMMAEGGSPLSYTLELPGGGSMGFDMPAEGIKPVVVETWQGILAAFNYVTEQKH